MLTRQQITSFHTQGYIILHDQFTEEELALIARESAGVMAQDCPRRILDSSGAIRSFFAPEQDSEPLAAVTRLERLVVPARLLLGSDVYIHQSKLNVKEAFRGDRWEWHQDFPFWHLEDAMPLPRVLTAMIMLDEANEYNGPLLFIPGSHVAGLVDTSENRHLPENDLKYMSSLTANLKYTIKQDTLAQWINKNGIVSARGKAGTVVFFNSLVFHASSNNVTPWNRNSFLITYNSVENVPADMPDPRPSFLANRNFTPVTELVTELDYSPAIDHN